MHHSHCTVLIIAPHPDDETLGVGGTLLKHHDAGDDIHWLLMTRVDNDPSYSAEFKKHRVLQLQRVKDFYNFKSVSQLNFPPTQLDITPLRELIGMMLPIIESIKPHVVYIPNRSDPHSDHRITFSAAMACFKTFRNPYIRRILMYETPSETDFSPPLSEMAFQPNVFVGIVSQLERKLEAMRLYDTELGEHPFPRSITGLKALATVRGVCANVAAAEAFVLLKEIE